MVKSELIEELAAQCSVTYTISERLLNTFIKLIYQELKKGGEMQLSGFGTFSVHHRKGRLGINPQTFERMEIPDSNTPKFVAGQEFKRAVKLKRRIIKLRNKYRGKK
jgi:DNA-binding protein HU-beta